MIAAQHTCAFLDMDLTLTPHLTRSTVYQKRDHMAVFQEDPTAGTTAYRRFPHIDSKIADSAKYGVYPSQLHRFASLCSTFPAFRHNAIRLMTEMVVHGYEYRKLRRSLIQFKGAFQRIQAAIFQKKRTRKLSMKEKLVSTIHDRLQQQAWHCKEDGDR